MSDPLFNSISIIVLFPLKEAKWSAANPSSSVLKLIHSIIYCPESVFFALITRAVAISSKFLKQAKWSNVYPLWSTKSFIEIFGALSKHFIRPALSLFSINWIALSVISFIFIYSNRDCLILLSDSAAFVLGFEKTDSSTLISI
jgi:hypothetical protein